MSALHARHRDSSEMHVLNNGYHTLMRLWVLLYYPMPEWRREWEVRRCSSMATTSHAHRHQPRSAAGKPIKP